MSARSKEAMVAYRRGALEEALSIQRRVVAAQKPKPAAEDFLLLAMFLHSGKQTAEAVSVMQDGLRLYPNAPALYENIGVCLLAQNKVDEAVEALQRALELGSQATNVLDALCRALGDLGRTEESIAHGRRSLELKDARFGAAPAIGTIPDGPPAPFDPASRSSNVISYALWGAEPRYLLPLLENLRIRNHLFPDWTVRIYLDRSVPEEARKQLERGGADLRIKEQPADEPPARKLLWRFEVMSDPAVKRFLVRDADSFLSVKERVAVDDWLRSAKYFHLMRDFRSHTDLVLAGLWGGVGGVLPSLATLLKNFKPWRVENDHVDQDLLAVSAWPTVRQSCLIHDSVFTGCLGSVPFPPYGELPKGHHVGQNAFIHFRQQK